MLVQCCCVNCFNQKWQGLKLDYFSGQDAFQPRDRIPRTPAKTESSGKNDFIVF